MQFAPLLVAVVATALVLGCQQAPARPGDGASISPALPHVSPALELKAEGDALAAKADHHAAAEVYRRAAALDPDDMSIRFALGTAHTFLDQKSEAVEAFRGVVARGDPASVEYREAKRWLKAVGVPDVLESVPSAGPATAKKTVAEATPERQVGGRLVARMEWPGFDPAARAIRGEMWIHGAEPLTEAVKRQRPINLGGKYAFYDIPAGQYRITARFDALKDVMVWDQKVMVEDGRPTELILTPATALVPPDKFPPPPAS
jgi:tetratricopeptide (TPR) repeat protein